MKELEKITLDDIRYIVWDESQGIRPKKSGIALLLSDHNGVGADVLLVLPKNRPLAVRAYAKDGSEIVMDAGARRAASFAIQKLTMLTAGMEASASDASLNRIEVRLTDAFCSRLFPSENHARIAV